jgi:carbamoyltransferase
MNCSANGKLFAAGIADDMWLFPASGDGGLSVGAALLAARDLGEYQQIRLESPYWGPSFDDAECEAALHEMQLTFARSSALSNEVASMLAAGDVVGWFQGRMELGPRALGNRSILADPRTVAMRDKANRIKRRESWRPLAPSILSERTRGWFALTPPNAFMLFAVQATAQTRERAPAIVHVDGSARPQPVTRELNPRYYDLLAEFERLTGVPILLNTSFNAAGEPIVCSPRDAVKTFLSTDLDALVLGPFIARKTV